MRERKLASLWHAYREHAQATVDNWLIGTGNPGTAADSPETGGPRHPGRAGEAPIGGADSARPATLVGASGTGE
ncbi:hypothetical protein [Salinactinospora qingdaonensis]|uniref:Uncharacterized protein n=1 Tax=Salinactinospora qingdaonensis TaxID=702744 RepID=A0ABP7FFM4_9ACTN